MRTLLPLLLICGSTQVSGQADSAVHFPHADTLSNVTVQAFSLRVKWKDAPAAVFPLGSADLQRITDVSLVPALGAVPGVRMEERSPASYRLSIRGSLLRSPFGVRNIKVYWDDMPLTDAGGNTYLNLIDPSAIGQAEVLKGPASSLYGANTGGALLLHAGQPAPGLQLKAALAGGSYGVLDEHLSLQQGNARSSLSLVQFHVQGDDYRQQSAMRKDGVQLSGRWAADSGHNISYLLSYTDLWYQTPGGLTLAEMNLNDRQARPATAAGPGAIQQQASVLNRTFTGGFTFMNSVSKRVDNTTTLLIGHTSFVNPAILNYEERNEWNVSVRNTLRFQLSGENKWSLLAGVEANSNNSHIDDYGNRNGTRDTVQFRDIAKITQGIVFVQTQAQPMFFNEKLFLQAGVSANTLQYHFSRPTDPAQAAEQSRSIRALLAPRISLLYKAANALSIYVIASKGFSPPALAEVRPSDGNYYSDLQPEYGWDYELGLKGSAFNSTLAYDINFYSFGLKDAIVRKNNPAGAEYFVNAGSTSQRGIEAWVKWNVLTGPVKFSLFNSFTYQPYRFTDYVSAGVSYSGNPLTGVPAHINVSGLDLAFPSGFYVRPTFNQTGSLSLNDANTAAASSYQLLQARMGLVRRFHRIALDLFVSGDNLLDQQYSLGNDINAAAGRYYNPAPRRNFLAGVSITFF